MPRRKRHRGRTAVPARPRPAEGLGEADSLMRHKRWAEARDLLEALARRAPRDVEVLVDLVNVSYELQDWRGYQRAAERLITLTPDDPELTLGLAGAYLSNIHPALALRTFRRFLDRYPGHGRADEVRKTVADLDARMPDLLSQLGLSGEDALELAVLHEEAQALLEQGSYREAQTTAERLLRRRPDFVPALNNLGQLHAIEGRLDRAIATAERVLAVDAENVHALSNLTRFCCLRGRVDEAGPWADRLIAIRSERVDRWIKQAEALSYLGDDQGVLDAFQGAERAGIVDAPLGEPLLYHLAAVATMRLGREGEGRRLWQRALKQTPGLEVAAANLADLRQPIGERHGPWAFPFVNWVPQRALGDLAALIKPASGRDDDQVVTRAARRFLRQHPEIPSLVPLLLDRGDPQAREFALRIGLLAETPELLSALLDFALGQRGPDAMRQQAAQAASKGGLLAPGPTRLWMQGQWQEVMQWSFEVHGEPSSQLAPRARQWQEAAVLALRRGDSQEAERPLERALEVEPEEPSLLNNLAAAYGQQGRTEAAQAVIRRAHERHPDYLFARVSLAQLASRRGDLDEARALLEPLLSRRQFHFSEFAAVCNAHIELALAEGNREAARSYLELWANADPDNPGIESWRRRLDQHGWQRWLPGRRRSTR